MNAKRRDDKSILLIKPTTLNIIIELFIMIILVIIWFFVSNIIYKLRAMRAVRTISNFLNDLKTIDPIIFITFY